jgi:hypothetical protein
MCFHAERVGIAFCKRVVLNQEKEDKNEEEQDFNGFQLCLCAFALVGRDTDGLQSNERLGCSAQGRF